MYRKKSSKTWRLLLCLSRKSIRLFFCLVDKYSYEKDYSGSFQKKNWIFWPIIVQCTIGRTETVAALYGTKSWTETVCYSGFSGQIKCCFCVFTGQKKYHLRCYRSFSVRHELDFCCLSLKPDKYSYKTRFLTAFVLFKPIVFVCPNWKSPGKPSLNDILWRNLFGIEAWFIVFIRLILYSSVLNCICPVYSFKKSIDLTGKVPEIYMKNTESLTVFVLFKHRICPFLSLFSSLIITVFVREYNCICP